MNKTGLAVFLTLMTWIVGLVADANFGTGDFAGFLNLRFLLPLLVMGTFILSSINKDR